MAGTGCAHQSASDDQKMVLAWGVRLRHAGVP